QAEAGDSSRGARAEGRSASGGDEPRACPGASRSSDHTRSGKTRRAKGARARQETRRQEADDEAGCEKARAEGGRQVQAESLGQDREKKVVRGNTAWRCNRARPRPGTNRFEKSHPRP